ncbi:type IV secretion system protein [Massilia pseudoviolaceinigra]|uniref:type IV secretion system protein n=1 Tax=Massilia pseudoviolaceinigra TaxID=3057165 RepID=UPI0027963CE0|nr:type IV secretion system protein [Massilia sp. CCM 9206]MDQ1922679.1 type IV secretion system protein [Massilia sp. CCM 9206]
MGIATKLEASIDGLVKTFITDTSQNLSGVLAPLAVTGACIYLLLMGYSIMRGDAKESVQTVLWKCFRIALISGLVFGAGEYQGMVVAAVQGLQDGLIEAISGEATMGSLIDNMMMPFAILGKSLLESAITGYIPAWGYLAAFVLVSLAQAALFVIGIGYYLLAKISLALVLGVGPIFILCAMFPATQKYTENWIGQAMNYVLLNVLVAACIAMTTGFVSDYAADVTLKKDEVNTVFSAMALFIACASLAVVMLNLPQLASALAGGASISGIGREIASAAMSGGKYMAGKMKAPPPPPPPLPPTGGSIAGQGGAGGGQGGGAQPLYQRETIENIQNSA